MTTASNQTKSARLLAIDVFRGATIALMFIVNNPGSWEHTFAPLQHAYWHGCTPTDWVFPFFLFTVGISASLSLKKYQAGTPSDMYKKIFIRALKIFLIGLALNAFLINNYQYLRILGVLQRIALAYLFGTIICISFSRKIVALWGVVLALGYWGILVAFSDAKHPYGFALTNDKGIEYKMDSTSLANNIVTKVDRAILGDNHVWKGKGVPFDPEGLVSTIPAVVTVILGFFCGVLIQENKDRRKLVIKMALYGLIALLLSWLWHYGFPINKSLWTSSFVLHTAGIAMIINALFIYVIDVLAFKGWTYPFIVMGMNSILAFVVAGVWAKWIGKFKFADPFNAAQNISLGKYFYKYWFMPLGGGDNDISSFLYALGHVLFFWFILWIFYKRNIFIKA